MILVLIICVVLLAIVLFAIFMAHSSKIDLERHKKVIHEKKIYDKNKEERS